MRKQNKANLEGQELPGMPEKGPALSRAQKLKREIEEYTRAMKGEAGPLIGRSDAARVMGVSRQRVEELVQHGRLDVWQFFDAKFVSLPQVLKFEKKGAGGKSLVAA